MAHAHDDLCQRQLSQAQGKHLEQQKEHKNRKQRHRDLQHVGRKAAKICAAQLHRSFKAADHHIDIRLRVRGIDCAQQHHRHYRSDRAQSNQTEAVCLGVFVASDGRNADAQRHDKRHRHRSCRHAAGIKRD